MALPLPPSGFQSLHLGRSVARGNFQFQPLVDRLDPYPVRKSIPADLSLYPNLHEEAAELLPQLVLHVGRMGVWRFLLLCIYHLVLGGDGTMTTLGGTLGQFDTIGPSYSIPYFLLRCG